jgi:hypothetical protein
VASFTPLPFYPQGKNPWYPLHRRLDTVVKRKISMDYLQYIIFKIINKYKGDNSNPTSLTARVRFPTGTEILSSSSRQNRLWGPPSLLYVEAIVSLRIKEQVHGTEISPSLVPTPIIRRTSSSRLV